MRNVFVLLFFIFFCQAVDAQLNNDSLCTDVSLYKDYHAIDSNCLVLVDSNNVIVPANILQPQHWLSYNYLKLKKSFVPVYWINKTLYLKFTLQNGGKLPDTIAFYPGISFHDISLYKISPSGNLQLVKDESKGDGTQPIALLPKEKTSFIAALHFTKRALNVLHPQIIQLNYLNTFEQMFYTGTYNQLVVGYMLSGLLLMMIFFNGANFRLSRKKEFLYNCCYAICMFLLVFFNTYVQRRSGVFASFFMGYLAFALLIIGMVFYIAFTRKFLDTKANYPLLNKIFYYEEKGLLLLLACYSYLYFFTSIFWLQSLLENTMKIIVMAMGALYIVISIRQKNKLLSYLAMGNLILLFFSFLSFLLIIFPVNSASIFASAIIYFETGIVCELVFFLLGLSYKNRVELIEKIKEQEAMKRIAETQIFETKIAILNAQQDERNRISADMHDDLGAGVTAIRLFSELAKSRLGNESVPEIEKISSSANELLNNMNAIIWTMNSSNDSFGSMVAYIRSYAIEYFENTGIKCSVSIEADLPEFAVNGEIRRNVFLVVKEALNNILKHAGATEVALVLKREGTGISLFIQDNGTGIDMDNLRRFGNGLKNMKQRMLKSGIDFSIENKNGTLVSLHHSLLQS